MNDSFKNKVVVITGSASGIGKGIKEAFLNEGAIVCGIDLLPTEYYQGDISKQEDLDTFVNKILNAYENIDYLINNAPPLFEGIDNTSYEAFNQSLLIGLSAPYYLCKAFREHFNKDACIINISSTRSKQSMANTEAYSAAKGGLDALTHALAMSLAGKVRVNAISPGWIDTHDSNLSLLDNKQHPVKRVGKVEDISNLVLFLCSEKASFITGENIVVDGGMSKQMIYHDEHGWTYHE